jgi:hypothetical protein
MEKIKLKIYEVYSLQSELLGNMNRQTGEVYIKGLLNEKLSIATKYYLDKLSETLSKEIEKIEKLKEEFIKEKGQEDEKGGLFIPMRINEEFNEQGELVNFDVNPVYLEVQEEINKLMMGECEIEYRPFTLEELKVETEVNPQILFKLIQETPPTQ